MNNFTRNRFFSLLIFLISVSPVISLDYQCQPHFPPDDISTPRGLNRSIELFGLEKIILTAHDSRFIELRRHANNLRHNANAAYIALPKTSSDVMAILRFAMANDLRPTIRSGKHCYEDFWSNNTGGILIDMSRMDRIYQLHNDPTIWVESGTLIGRLYDILFSDYGLTAPVASCADVGVGGNVLGGGYGLLVRKYGPIVDHVDTLEIVYVDAKKRVDSIQVGRNSMTEKDRNLFWALRGAGVQNFGVVTRIGFKNLPASPPVVYKYAINWNLNKNMNQSAFQQLLTKFVKFLVANSSVDNENCDMHVGVWVGRSRQVPSASLSIILYGEKKYLADNLIALLGLNKLDFKCDKMSYNRFLHESDSHNILSDGGSYYLQRSAYMVGEIPQHQLDAVWKYMTDPAYSFLNYAGLQFNGYGCAVRQYPEDATAYPHRNAVVKLQYGTSWYASDNADDHWNWSRNFYREMYGMEGPKPDDVMDGCFMNYPDGELIDWQHLYFKGNYERLKQVKMQWDPLNIFYHRQSVELPFGRRHVVAYDAGKQRSSINGHYILLFMLLHFICKCYFYCDVL